MIKNCYNYFSVDNVDSVEDQAARAELHNFHKENMGAHPGSFRRSYQAPPEMNEEHAHTEL